MKHRFMKFRQDILKAAPLIMMGLFLTWCGYYLVLGDNSIFALKTMKLQEAQLSQNLVDVRTQREGVEAKVTRLRPDTLDWDMVEEQATMSLGEMPKDKKALKM